MQIIYEEATGKIMCWWDERAEGALVPTPEPGQIRTTLEISRDEFEAACRESAGDFEGEGVGENFLHQTVSQADASNKTFGKGVRVGHMAVEAEHKANHVRPNEPITDVMMEQRRRQGKPVAGNILMQDMQEAELARKRGRYLLPHDAATTPAPAQGNLEEGGEG